MKIKDFVNVTRNRANNQLSFNLKAKQLKKSGLTAQTLLNVNFNFPKPQNSIITKKEVRNKVWKK